MSLLFCDGFDHYATADITKKWTTQSLGTINTSAGRRSGGAWLCANGNAYLTKTLPGSYSTIIMGFAWKPVVAGAANAFIAVMREGSIEHIALNFNAANKFEIVRGGVGGTILATSTSAFSTGSFYFVELKVNVHDSTGVAVLKINGVIEINVSSIDTRNGGTGIINNVGIGDPATWAHGGNDVYDDLYVCDTAGSAPNNDFLGDCRIDTLFPSADGSNSAWTPSTGTAHFSLVDEGTPNTTDYVESNVVGSKDTWNFQDLAAITGIIYGAQICTAALKDDAGGRSIANTVKSGAANADGATQAMSTSQVYFLDVFAVDPATGAAWTEANLNAAEFGVKVAA